MHKEYDIEKLVGEMDFSSHQLQMVGNHLFLTNHEIEVLKRYQIDYSHAHHLKEILFEIEECLQEEVDSEELEGIAQTISERDYYQNTHQ